MGAGADLNLPVFDADQVAAADCRGAAGVPPGVSAVPVPGFRVGIDKPDLSVVPDGQGLARHVESDQCVAGLRGGVGDGAHGVVFFRGAVVLAFVGLGGFDEGEFVPVRGVAGREHVPFHGPVRPAPYSGVAEADGAAPVPAGHILQ